MISLFSTVHCSNKSLSLMLKINIYSSVVKVLNVAFFLRGAADK